MKKQIRTVVCVVAACFLLLTQTLAVSLIPIGRPAGVCMSAKGVIVSALTQVETASGMCRPAEEAGIKAGDILLTANEVELSSGEQLASLSASGKTLQLTGLRGEKEFSVSVTPVRSVSDRVCHIGLLVRDSMAGIGTITYIDPSDGSFGALGHAVCDVDSGVQLPLSSGLITPAEVISVIKGQSGSPGELIGSFEEMTHLGSLEKNTAFGIFGKLSDERLYQTGTCMETAEKEDIHAGKAQILSCVSGEEPKYYDIKIEHVYRNAKDGRGMAIKIVDKQLIEKTGGIVQGMSGSPIIQDGCLVGAVTHVLVTDATRGYGIAIEDMLQAEGAN